MKGKADMLVAHRTLSALVVVCLVISAFAGLLFLTNPAATRAQGAIGDLVVTGVGNDYVIDGIVQPVDGNVTVSAGGHLTVQDGTLSIISNYASTQRHTITVGVGGKLTLNHGTITSYLDQITPWPFLDLIVNGGELEATGNSILMFPGHITLMNDAHVTLNDTEVMALPETEVTKYVVGTLGLITQDSANDGPALSITDSTMRLFDSAIRDLPEYPSDHVMATNITLSGSSVFLAVNSYLEIDFGPVNQASSWDVHNAMVLDDLSHAYLYGTSFERYSGKLADRAPAIVAAGASASPAVPLMKGAADNTLQSITSLAALDSNTYQVMATRTMEIDTFNVSTLSNALPVSSAALAVTYTVSGTYAGSNPIQWARQGTAYGPTTIVPRTTDTPNTDALFDIPLASVPTVGDIGNLNIEFINNGGVGTGGVEFDRMWVIFTVGSDAFIYKWLNATVGDEYGVPIPDATLSARFTGATELEGQPAIYYSPSGASAIPPAEILAYLGEDSTTYCQTKSDGKAVMPFLTDLISGTTSVNGVFVGSYALTGRAVLGTTHSSTETFSFQAYPAMSVENQSFDVTIELPGVSAPSPDSSRWLVVPVNSTVRSLTIADMTYYHAGDVIVAANGTLTFDNAVFELVQSHDNERTVYVDGTETYPARLVFENSIMTSQKKIDIIVKGDAILEVLNSTLAGVNIVAREGAHVLFRNSNMTGLISTAWDSEATIDIRDSVLDTTPVLSGTSSGSFTNCSVPSITVQDDATAYIYRWIHVTVLDGAGKPMPGVNVTARKYVTGEYMGSAITSSQAGQLGVAKVNSLGTVLTSSGSTFVGNYKVNASCTWGGRDWWADEVSVGVQPYTGELFKNATYATMTIDEAFPDLTIAADGVDTNRTYPMKGQSTMVTANVSNVGMSAAYDVSVEFYDVSNLAPFSPGSPFATVIVPMILPGATAAVKAVWMPGLPVFPYAHTLTVIADRLNTVSELNETEARGECTIQIRSLPDVEIRDGATEIYTSPSYVIAGETITIYAYVHNVGDNDTAAFTVEFRDGTTLFRSYPITTLAAGSSQLISVTHTFAPTGLHKLDVWANTSFTELSGTNNRVFRDITVLDHPDLMLSGMQFYTTRNELVSSIPGGNQVLVSAWLRNLNPAPFSNPVVNMYATYTGDSSLLITGATTVDQVLTSGSNAVHVTVSFKAPDTYPGTITLNVRMVVNEGHSPIESGYGNNEDNGNLTVLDVRADLTLSETDIKVSHSNIADNITSEMFGKQVKVVVTVHNAGGREVPSFMLDIRARNSVGYNNSIKYTTSNVSRNATDNFVKVNYLWTINLTTPGVYQLYVSLDPGNQIQEPNEGNNIAWTNFTVVTLRWTATVIMSEGIEYKAGDTVLVSVTIKYEADGMPVKGLPGVQISLVDPKHPEVIVDGSSSPVLKTDENGQIAVAEVLAPTSLSTGMYTVRVVVTDAPPAYDSDTQVHVSEVVGGGLFPWWVWVLIAVSVVGVVAGFTVYTYVYGLGKLVECGECGAFIPAASKRCPKCGVEFEAGTMKCSECGAWIPAESTECPNCGVKFVGETEDEADYLERMKNEYEDMVSKYRELAKGELGKKFSDKDFESWWKRQPGYISFDDWLAKEEEKKKEGPVPCSVCGTLNPKEATVCHKCGTVFGAAKEAPQMIKKGPPPVAPGPASASQQKAGEQQSVQQQEPAQQTQQAAPAAAPRMVIRRPIDRKVVPKKIIKTPVVGEENQEGSQDSDADQQ